MMRFFPSYYSAPPLRQVCGVHAVCCTRGDTSALGLLSRLTVVVTAVELDLPAHRTVTLTPCVHGALTYSPQAALVVPDEMFGVQRVDCQLNDLRVNLLDQLLELLVSHLEELRRKHRQRSDLHEGLHVAVDHVGGQVQPTRPDATDVVVSTAALTTVDFCRSVECIQDAIACSHHQVLQFVGLVELMNGKLRNVHIASSGQDSSCGRRDGDRCRLPVVIAL